MTSPEQNTTKTHTMWHNVIQRHCRKYNLRQIALLPISREDHRFAYMKATTCRMMQDSVLTQIPEH